MVAVLAGAARLTRREVPDRVQVTDVALCALATEKPSRLLAKDPVTSPLRAPFTAYQGTSGPAELSEEVRGTGARKAGGELVTCPFCTSVWVATGFTAGLSRPHVPHIAVPYRGSTVRAMKSSAGPAEVWRPVAG